MQFILQRLLYTQQILSKPYNSFTKYLNQGGLLCYINIIILNLVIRNLQLWIKQRIVVKVLITEALKLILVYNYLNTLQTPRIRLTPLYLYQQIRNLSKESCYKYQRIQALKRLKWKTYRTISSRCYVYSLPLPTFPFYLFSFLALKSGLLILFQVQKATKGGNFRGILL